MNNQTEKRGFKRKTIEKTIQTKMNSWLKSIEDEKLRERVKAHYILTGGAIASMLLGDLPNDYDVYLDDVDVAADLSKYYVARLTCNVPKTCDQSANISDWEAGEVSVVISENRDRVSVRIPSSGVLDREDQDKNSSNKGKYKVRMITANAITLSDSVQIVLRFVGKASEIHKNYDFVHATNYYTEREKLVLHQAALESLMCRELKYVGSLYPVCSVFRIKKFVKRGWNITAGETLKILFDVSRLDLTDISVLEDQLTGVDTSFFTSLIESLRKGDTAFDRSYLFSLINQVFDGTEDEYDAHPNEDESGENEEEPMVKLT